MADSKKILIIEDDQFLSLILKGRLEKEGFVVTQAFDGQAGLDALKKEIPDLIILDLIMPRMSGFEFLEVLRTDPQFGNIPVVAATNLGQESDIQKARSLGVIDYYVKAQTALDDLVRMLKAILEKNP
jgi:CheY-like chemotaxis protein